MPEWTERHVPDLGVTLVELLAYLGDQISYGQDAVATEAYLETARLRTSVRRHVRLIDYPMHDGVNARAWVWLDVEKNVQFADGEFWFVTAPTRLVESANAMLLDADLRNVQPTGYKCLEPVVDKASTCCRRTARSTSGRGANASAAFRQGRTEPRRWTGLGSADGRGADASRAVVTHGTNGSPVRPARRTTARRRRRT
jgi:hypothetical protein